MEPVPGPAAPCRLFVFLASESPVGVVLRRGPSDWVRLSLWRTDADTFEHGQWLRGRVFERRSDLSADGSLFVAFVRSAFRPSRPEQRADSWLALSRPPYFTALALWWVGGTYCAGGCFPRSGALWVGWDAGPDMGGLAPGLSLVRDLPHLDRTNNWTDRTVWHNRLLRDGWQRATERPAETWERAQPDGPARLLLAERRWDPRAFGGPHVVEYAVARGDELVPLEGVTWADWDQRGRLVIARAGRLLEWRADGTSRELADFTSQQPARVPAPAWATS